MSINMAPLKTNLIKKLWKLLSTELFFTLLVDIVSKYIDRQNVYYPY